ncbi:endonuclease domain-containing protein [Aquimarina sp. M1]
MTSPIPVHQPESENIIRYSLNNSIPATEKLYTTLKDKGYFFNRNHCINNYTFDFYSPQLKIAIEVDGYAHEFTDVYSQDEPKKLHIDSLGITVLRFTDYQILVDIEEVIRTLKYLVKSAKNRKYVV